VVGDRRRHGGHPRLAVQQVTLQKQDGVDVGADQQTTEFHVVTRVTDDGRVPRGEHLVGTLQEFRGARAA
jgi:hypothetical protein